MSTPNEALEVLQRLKQQVDMAIGMVESGYCNYSVENSLNPSYPYPRVLRIGDFEIRDLKSHAPAPLP